MQAVCHRCGAEKAGPFDPCGACGVMPSPSERPVAWLLSAHHLQPAQLAEAARRVREGERPDPGRALRTQAEQALGADLPAEENPPLTRKEVGALVAANLLLTPLVGFAVWYGLRVDRPRASAQAFSATLPVTLALAGAWGALVVGRFF